MSNTEKRPKLDMLNGSIWNKIPQYALPVAATGIDRKSTRLNSSHRL